MKRSDVKVGMEVAVSASPKYDTPRRGIVVNVAEGWELSDAGFSWRVQHEGTVVAVGGDGTKYVGTKAARKAYSGKGNAVWVRLERPVEQFGWKPNPTHVPAEEAVPTLVPLRYIQRTWAEQEAINEAKAKREAAEKAERERKEREAEQARISLGQEPQNVLDLLPGWIFTSGYQFGPIPDAGRITTAQLAKIIEAVADNAYQSGLDDGRDDR